MIERRVVFKKKKQEVVESEDHFERGRMRKHQQARRTAASKP